MFIVYTFIINLCKVTEKDGVTAINVYFLGFYNTKPRATSSTRKPRIPSFPRKPRIPIPIIYLETLVPLEPLAP